jgi:hypothetical protein
MPVILAMGRHRKEDYCPRLALGKKQEILSEK